VREENIEWGRKGNYWRKDRARCATIGRSKTQADPGKRTKGWAEQLELKLMRKNPSGKGEYLPKGTAEIQKGREARQPAS